MNTNLLTSDNVFSADSTGHIQGLISKIKPAKLDTMTLPDGTKTATKIISDLIGTICDNQGNRLTKVMLSKVRYSPKNKLNVFSVLNILMNGWDLGGDGNAIWMKIINKQLSWISTLRPRKKLFLLCMLINICQHKKFPRQVLIAGLTLTKIRRKNC